MSKTIMIPSDRGVAHTILAPRTMLGPFVWWAILGGGMDGKRFN